MTRLRIHVLYEHGLDPRPNGSAYLRLLRPLAHQSLADAVELTYATDYHGQPVDVVIVDRLWRPDLSRAHVERLLDQVQRAGAALIYSLDDNFLRLDLLAQATEPDREAHAADMRAAVKLLLSESRGVLVNAEELREQLSQYSSPISVLPHALDERLLVAAPGLPRESHFGKHRKVIGYMGTATHDDDLLSIVPALHLLHQKYPDRFELEIVGTVGREATWALCGDLPIRRVNCDPHEIEYPSFMLWYTGHVRWDIALAPLVDTPFNRCKSDIKLLDYGAIGATGIYSRIPAYESSIPAGERGLVVENETGAWFAALEQLLLDDAVCQQLGRTAAEYVYATRTLATCAEQWPRAIESVLAPRVIPRQAAA